MATIKFKRGTTLNFPTGLTLAEPAFDYANNRLFVGVTSSAIWIGAGITTGDIGVGSTLIIPTQSAVRSYVIAGLSGTVSSVNGATGVIGITGDGINIAVSTNGRTSTISYIGTASSVAGVTSINGITGPITITAGSNITITNDSGTRTITIASTATSGAAGTKTLAVFNALDSNPPGTCFATLDTRNSVPVLEFDAALVESTFFTGIIPQGTILGTTLGAFLHFAGDTATGTTVAWGICMERMTGITGFSGDSFGAGIQINQILPATTAAIAIAGAASVPVPDGLTQGEAYRLLVRRIGTDATNDTAPGDAQLVMVELRNT